ncbi:hypothetical protein B0A52_01892 [Exophiala mesophila]|uniref:HSF-type DNA-binding domain-containing protein n=1 Tax=Exophiala mesophila TaxID=212818 RepID=A0A438NEB0_EXOME|nr:hypothetical protein B0A52_01892 [Exophiala mesophila]
MSTMFQSTLRNPFGSSSQIDPSQRSRSMAILPQNGHPGLSNSSNNNASSNGNTNTSNNMDTSPISSHDDSSMQATSPANQNMGPPGSGHRGTSPDIDPGNTMSNGGKDQNAPSASNTASAGAVGASQGPKVVQTAFIHKLYSMLEDRSIKHLIAWSNTNESFVMSPSSEFSKVLAQYFKHTNISSFVRQLNMYGFHKVSDVFHTGNPESALWEFKHGNGSFKKGDLMGLRDIKRRASRHTLIHRDSFSGAKPGPSQPGTPADILPQDSDQRMSGLEQAFYDIHARVQRVEDVNAMLTTRYQSQSEMLGRCHLHIQHLAGLVQTLSSADSSVYAEASQMQKDVARQLEQLRGLDTPTDPLATNGRPPYYPPAGSALEPPLSPRGYNYADSRRSSVQIEPQHVGLRPPVPVIPPQFSSPRRYGSISLPQASPGFSRPALPPQPPASVHPLASVTTPPPLSLARRHTSADIREHGWAPNQNPNGGSPYASGHSSVQWQPSSPQHPPHSGDQQIRDQLAQYEINGPRRQTVAARHPSPPPPSDLPPAGLGVENVSFANGSRFPRSTFELHSAPNTRRGSMATLHSLLNPAETAEQDNEDDGPLEDRKRKRLQ